MDGLSGYRITRKISDKIVKEGSLSAADSTFPLISGNYSLILIYAHPRHQPRTELAASEFTVHKGETTEIRLGALRVQIAAELQDLPAEALVLRDSGTGREVLRLLSKGNNDNHFPPVVLPIGIYAAALIYRPSAPPATLAKNVAVTAEKETLLALDSGLSVVRPSKTRIAAWELRPAGESVPLLTVRRSPGNEYPLWRPFPVPPGTYDLHLHVDGTDEILPAGEDISIVPGQIVRFNTGL